MNPTREPPALDPVFMHLFDDAPRASILYRVEADGSVAIQRRNRRAEALFQSDALLQGMRPDRLAVLAAEAAAARPDRVSSAPAGVTFQVIRDAAGKVTHVVATVSAGDPSRTGDNGEANRLLRLAEGIAHVGHWRFDLSDRSLLWSEELYRIHGRDAGFRPTRSKAVAAFHVDDRRFVANKLREAVTSTGSVDLGGRIVRPDGEERHVLVRGLMQHGGQGPALFGVMMDVTDLRRAEARLRETTAVFKATVDNLDQGLLMVDAGGRVPICNDRALGLLDLPEFLMASRPDVSEVRSYQARHGTFAPASAVMPGPAAGPTLCERTRSDGAVLEIRTVPLPTGGYVQTVTDISARRRAELELAAARDAAEAASRAKGEFLATMSHEIRTPLNAILGYTDLMIASGMLAPEQNRHAAIVQSSGGALLTLVNDILDFSKLEAGAVTLIDGPFSLSALVATCLAIVDGVATAKSLRLEAVIPPSLPDFWSGDEARLRQILLNLLNNAVKFTAAGSVTLAITAESCGEASGRLRFDIADTGIGIAPDAQHRLFKRFSQVDGSIGREFGGTGLGLAICKMLVDTMHGEIGVTSDVGKGARFWFSVDLARTEEAVASHKPNDDAALWTAPGRLLLVEDVGVNQELAKVVLETWGHSVAVAADGATAVAAVAAGDYDLVLMDLQMPGMDGLTATRLIRALPPPRGLVPIVAMTANVLPEQIALCKAAGMDDHVCKPFDRNALRAAVARSLASRDRGRAATFDGAIQDQLVSLLGRDVVAGLSARFMAELKVRLIASEPLDQPLRLRLRHDAHALVPAAGMLGFVALAKACSDLHACCESEVERDGGLAFKGLVGRLDALKAAALDHANPSHA